MSERSELQQYGASCSMSPQAIEHVVMVHQ